MDEALLRSTVEAMTWRVVRALSSPRSSLDDLVEVIDVQEVLTGGEPGSQTVMAELLTTFSYGAGLIADPIEVDRPAGISPAASLYGTDMLRDAVGGGRARLLRGWPGVVVKATSLPASEAPLLCFMMAKGYARAVELCGGVAWVEHVAGLVRRLLATSEQPPEGLDRVELQEAAQLVIAAAGRHPEQAEHILGRLCRRTDADYFITVVVDLMIAAAATVLGSGLGVELDDERLKRDNIGFPDSVLVPTTTANVVSSQISQRSRGQQRLSALTPQVLFGSTYEAALAALYAARLVAIHLPPAQVSMNHQLI